MLCFPRVFKASFGSHAFKQVQLQLQEDFLLGGQGGFSQGLGDLSPAPRSSGGRSPHTGGGTRVRSTPGSS